MGNLVAIGVVIALMLAPLGQLETVDDREATPTPDDTPPSPLLEDISPRMNGRIDHLGYSFIENLGQLDNPAVRFYSPGTPLSIGLTREGVVFTLTDEGVSTSFTMTFEGGNPVEPVGVEDVGYPTNFLIGNDPDEWVRGASSFEEVLLEGIYEGVDLRYYFLDGMFKYDLICDPTVEPSRIVLAYTGLDGLAVDPTSGNLLMTTAAGTLEDMRPVVIAGTGDEERRWPGDFSLLGGSKVGFEMPRGVPKGVAYTIDPGLEFCTYLSASFDVGMDAMDVGEDGCIYVAGDTVASDFPVTDGAYCTTFGAFMFYVAKFDPTLSELEYSTFIGTRANAFGMINAIRVDRNGRAFCVGYADGPSSFPTTQNALMPDHVDGKDGFITVLTSDGADLAYGTFVGGPRSQNVDDIALQGTESFVITMRINDTGFPVTAGAYCTTLAVMNPPTNDYFPSGAVLKFNATDFSLVYSTLVAIQGHITPQDVDIDTEGNAFLTGYVAGGTIETTPGAYDRVKDGSPSVFVMKLNADGTDALASTYFESEQGAGSGHMSLMGNGSVCLMGSTRHTTHPLTQDAYCTTFAHSGMPYLAVLSSDLTQLQYGTLIPGRTVDRFMYLAYDDERDVLYGMTHTQSVGLPTTQGAFDRDFNGDYDFYLIGINMTTRALQYASYFGGDGREDSSFKQSMAITPTGMVAFMGYLEEASNIPTTEGALQEERKGPSQVRHGFVAVIHPRPVGPPQVAPSNVMATGEQDRINISWDEPPRMVGGTYLLGLRVQRGLDPGDLDPVGMVQGGSYLDTNVTNGVTYHYAVSYVNHVGEGLWSEEVSAAPFGLPGEVGNVTYETGNGTVILHWEPPEAASSEGVTKYRVYRAETRDLPPLPIATLGNETSWTDDDVDVGQWYYYWLAAYNEHFWGPVTSPLRTQVKDVPDEPKNFRVVEGDGRVELYWGVPEKDGDSGIIGYWVFRRSGTGEPGMIAQMAFDKLSFIDTNVSNGAPYSYHVIAYNKYNAPGEGRSTQVRDAVPYGLPSPPRALSTEGGNGQVVLTWSPPEYDNGRSVTGYRIYFSQNPSDFASYIPWGNTTSYTHSSVTNGITYYYYVVAMNERGESAPSATLSATPVGPPGVPAAFSVVSANDGPYLDWDEPVDTGGAASISYIILRGPSEDDLEPIDEVYGFTDYTDTTAVGGTSYYYAVRSNSTGGRGQSTLPMPVLVAKKPSTVGDLVIGFGDSTVTLSWSAPVDDGGAEVTRYYIMRGLLEDALVEIDFVGGTVKSYTDVNVDNGKTYFYAVVASNSIGRGDSSQVMSTMPLGLPLPVSFLQAKVEGGTVNLTWTPPDPAGRSPVLGYHVYRSVEGGPFEKVEEIGTLTAYTDGDVKAGKAYRYYLVAVSDLGDGQESSRVRVSMPSNGVSSSYLMPLLIVIVLVIVGVTAVVAWRRTQKGPDIIPAAQAAAPAGAETPDQAMSVRASSQTGYIVQEVFVVYGDGRLIKHCARAECETQDADLMSGMLIAIQGLIQDGLHSGGKLESIKYGENTIHMVPGSYINLAAVLYGKPDRELEEWMDSIVQNIETIYAGVIEDWTGDLAALEGLDDLVTPLIEGTGHLSQEDVKAIETVGGISLLSAVDFYMGYVRLKVAAANMSKHLIANASFEVEYDSDMLRLEKVEPDSFRLHGDRVDIGNVKPGVRKTVAFFFDPQICQGTTIDGSLAYFDTTGERHRVNMKRRQADIVCPIFFTKEHANTAMLRKLVAEKLYMSDFRAFRYPKDLEPSEVLAIGKRAIDVGEVQVVREYVVPGPPYEAEVWYYGETRVKGYQIVMRLGVVEDKGALEYFAASTAMEPITGLLSEFRRELNRIASEKYTGDMSIEPETDAGFRKDLEDRELLIFKFPDEE